MLKAVGKNPEGECLGFRDGFFAISSIGKDSWKLRNLPKPPPILFTFKLDSEIAHLIAS